MVDYSRQSLELLRAGSFALSDIKPSHWAESRLVMGKPFPGPFKYKGRTPYTQEIIDCLAPDHPARIIAFKKGAQFGGTAGIVMPFIGWMIENAPGNTIFTVGHESLVEPAMDKLDAMLDSTGVRRLIRPSAQRLRASKSGDTNTKKEFPFGYVKVSAASNHKIWRQVDYQYGLVDDYEAVKKQSKESGDTLGMIMQRFAAYADTMKLLLMSTPELDATSNIQPAFLAGDQRQYFIECPCCKKFIVLKWNVKIDEKNSAGMTWKTDSNHNVIKDSVGYICQECSRFFNDRNKTKIIDSGHWEPTATPTKEGYYSYQASSLLAPVGMYDWYHYACDYMAACPPGQPRIEAKYKTFVNLCLAETYTEPAEQLSANQLQKNIRPYKIGTVPEELSKKDGNGEIVMLTAAIDMNGTVYNEGKGTVDDARLDWEVLAHSETGSTYSVASGSIGTFIPREGSKKIKVDRLKWTYAFDKENSVWPELDKILESFYPTDNGRQMQIFTTALDCGFFTTAYAYPYLSQRGQLMIGIKGAPESEMERLGVDTAKFKVSTEDKRLYILRVGKYKDKLAELMGLKHDPGQEQRQPPGFCNYPEPADGLYSYANYFQHYEAEQKVPVTDAGGQVIGYIWEKKTSTAQNHFFDVRLYNMAVRDIIVEKICKKAGIQNYSWTDFARLMLGK
jgi:phage terminase large subunit GpA-like protein